MSISYLLSILELYLSNLSKTNNSELLIEVDNEKSMIKFNFYYSFDTINKTYVTIKKETFFANLKEIMQKIKANLNLEIEKLEVINQKKHYIINFSNQRIVTFLNFSKEEMKLIRDSFTNISEKFDFDIKNDTYDKKILTINSPKLKFSMGFATYMSIFLSSIFLLDILMIALWIFKAFIS